MFTEAKMEIRKDKNFKSTKTLQKGIGIVQKCTKNINLTEDSTFLIKYSSKFFKNSVCWLGIC